MIIIVVNTNNVLKFRMNLYQDKTKSLRAIVSGKAHNISVKSKPCSLYEYTSHPMIELNMVWWLKKIVYSLQTQTIMAKLYVMQPYHL